MIVRRGSRFQCSWWRSRIVGYDVSAYLHRGVLIDTAFPGIASEVAALLDEVRPSAVVVTHMHEDHAGNVAAVARRGIPIAIASETLEALRTGEENVMFYRRAIWTPMPRLTEPVTRCDDAQLAASGLRMIHTPGHSSDHHVVWDADDRTLYSADLFLAVKVRVARPFENIRALARSVREMCALAPRKMFDAHRGEIADPVASLTAKADWLDETIAAIDTRVRAGVPDRVIRDEILGRETLLTVITGGDLSRLNFVASVRRTLAS